MNRTQRTEIVKQLRAAAKILDNLKRGDKVTLPAGTPIPPGNRKLKKDTVATVDRVEADGTYRVVWFDDYGAAQVTKYVPE